MPLNQIENTERTRNVNQVNYPGRKSPTTGVNRDLKSDSNEKSTPKMSPTQLAQSNSVQLTRFSVKAVNIGRSQLNQISEDINNIGGIMDNVRQLAEESANTDTVSDRRIAIQREVNSFAQQAEEIYNRDAGGPNLNQADRQGLNFPQPGNEGSIQFTINESGNTLNFENFDVSTPEAAANTIERANQMNEELSARNENVNDAQEQLDIREENIIKRRNLENSAEQRIENRQQAEMILEKTKEEFLNETSQMSLVQANMRSGPAAYYFS